jgi:hypothetical protein
MPPRLIQLIALVVALGSAVTAGTLLPRLLRVSELHTLRYTDVAIDGAPPIVQIGTAIGALRGLIVDYLWLKVQANKQKGLFYDIMADSELITKLQPRFAEVWGFHGHNMAYNISVMTNTPEERWEWVNAGLRLVREQGLRYNPNDVVLHKELAFWLSHKVDGVTDDAHFFYKKELAREWHLLLGPPPVEHQERIAWMKALADAPDTLEEAIDGRPAMNAPVELLEEMSRALDAAAERAFEREKRRITGSESLDVVRPLIDGAGVTPVVAAELRRLAQAVDDGRDAAARFRAAASAGGELHPAIPGTPKVRELVERLKRDLEPFGARFQYRPNREFLLNYGRWEAVKRSRYAILLGMEQAFMANDPIFRTFAAIGDDPEYQEAWKTLLAHLRRRVLLDEYNMDPQLMYEYTRDIGPLDWRHPQAHALYFARRGSQFGTKRYENVDEIYKVINNDRLQIQAMQALARSGLMLTVDPFSDEVPGRLSETDWIKAIDRFYAVLIDRHYETRGGGGDTFVDFHQNFMKQAVRELYRAGDEAGAQEVLDRLDRLYGQTGLIANPLYRQPLDIFVQTVTYEEYEYQPEVARSDVYAALTRGFREGLLRQKPELLEQALKFAAEVTTYFKKTHFNDFVNKFGEARLAGLIGSLDQSTRDVLAAVLTDPTLPLVDRLFIFNRSNEAFRRLVYDEVRPIIQAEFQRDPIAQAVTLEVAFPEPPGMEEHRAQKAAEKAAAEEKDPDGGRGEYERK